MVKIFNAMDLDCSGSVDYTGLLPFSFSFIKKYKKKKNLLLCFWITCYIKMNNTSKKLSKKLIWFNFL